jgi:hypothetical protein
MTFWCGSGSGDPCLCSDPDPAIFVIDLQDASKQSIVLLPRACSRFEKGKVSPKQYEDQAKRGQCQFKRGQCQFKRGQCQFKRGECKIKRKRALQRHAKGQKQASASLQTSQLSTTSFPNKIRGAR